MRYPPTPLGAEALRGASATASEGYPPTAKSAEALMLRYVIDSATFCAFIHGQSPWSSAQADKVYGSRVRVRMPVSSFGYVLGLKDLTPACRNAIQRVGT